MISMTRCFREENRKVIVNGRWLLLLFGIVVWLSSNLAQAQSAIRSVSTSNVDGFELVRVEADGPINAVPASFTLQKPARISLDFNGFVNQTGRNFVEVSQSALRSINILEASGRTRLVLNLNRPVKYDIELRGNIAEIRLDNTSFDEVSSTPSAGRAATFSSQLSDVSPASLNDVDFRRGEDGSGRVMVELSDPQTAVDIRQQGRNLVVEFLRTTLPEGLRRRLDVADFGTPVRMVTATQVGDRVRLLVEPTGDWEHSAYQSDNRFVLEVRPVKADPSKLVTGPKYSGEKLSLNFQNIDVRSLLQVIADFTNFNIVTSDSVQGNLTLRLKDVPWDQALDIILESKALGMVRTGNVIRVAPKKELDAEAVAQREISKKLEDLEPLRTEVFRLNFAKAEEVANTLKDSTSSGAGDNQSTNRILSPRGSAIADVRTNQVFVTDVAGRLEAVRDYIRRVDSPKRQVMIQARIVQAREGFSKTLGVRLGGADLRGVRGGDAGYSIGGGNRVAFGGSYDAITATTRQSGGEVTSDNSSFINLPSRSSSAAKISLALFNPAANRFLNLELSALESDNKGRVISSPRLITGDLNKAVIKQGERITKIFRRLAADRDDFLTVDAALILEVTPQITPSGQVLLNLKTSKNELIENTDISTRVGVKEIETEVMVENGGTVMIGGIFEQDEKTSVDKVPVLGDVPVVGNLFKRREAETTKTETLIFITPVILENGVAVQ
jgi:type IV pilus assembly protein PilQ